MAHPLTSRKRAHSFSTALFMVGLAILIYTGLWWPGIMLIVGLPMALRQYLLGRSYDTIVTLIVFVGTFVTVEYDISWQVFLPILLSLGALYLFLREMMEVRALSEEEQEEDLNHEIEEKKKK